MTNVAARQRNPAQGRSSERHVPDVTIEPNHPPGVGHAGRRGRDRHRRARRARAHVVCRRELHEGDTDDGAYTIRNPSGTTVALPVAPDVAVTAVDCGPSACVEGVEVEYGALTRRLADGDGTSSYWLTVDDGVVVRIDEKYLASVTGPPG